MTWRESIKQANEDVAKAYKRRRQVFRDAHGAGLSLRQIAEAAETSASNVHKIVGKDSEMNAISLDSEAPTSTPEVET